MSELIERAAARYLPAGRWAHGFARGKMRGDPVYQRVLDRLRPQGTLVDVGCGEGHLLALAAELHPGLSLFGLDHDEARVLRGRQALPQATLVVEDVRTAELPQATVIACLDVLHYMPPQDQDRVLARFAEALEPGGTLLLRDGEREAGLRSTLLSWSEGLAVATGRHKGEGVWFRTRGEMLDALAGCSLTAQAEDCSEGTPFANVLYLAVRDRTEP